MMLLVEDRGVRVRDSWSLLGFSRSRTTKLGSRRLDWTPVDGDCRICAADGNPWLRSYGGEGNNFAGQKGGFSHESEHDLGMMVSEFLENGSSGAESLYSSDSDSGISNLDRLEDKILFLRSTGDKWESLVFSSVRSILAAIDVGNLSSCASQCGGACIKQALVHRLRLSGHDAALCTSTWSHSGNLPGGDHEYVDVVNIGKAGLPERLIVDVDFRSHFQIARAVASYDAILNSLPPVFVGSMARLKQLLQIMADAAELSLNQNSMPLPPWRSLPYLQAKWMSEYVRKCFPDRPQCIGQLRMLHSPPLRSDRMMIL